MEPFCFNVDGAELLIHTRSPQHFGSPRVRKYSFQFSSRKNGDFQLDYLLPKFILCGFGISL